MGYDIFNDRKKEYVTRYNIETKNDIIWDILNIEHSFSGRMDTPFANIFIRFT